MKNICINCGKDCSKNSKKYCSQNCYIDFRYKNNVNLWIKGEISGHKNCSNNDLKTFVRKYILEQANYRCEKCNFSGINIKSGKTILQINHIDGNSKNSKRNNLEAICPNCHAMTETFMGLNRGKSTRLDRYKEA